MTDNLPVFSGTYNGELLGTASTSEGALAAAREWADSRHLVLTGAEVATVLPVAADVRREYGHAVRAWVVRA